MRRITVGLLVLSTLACGLGPDKGEEETGGGSGETGDSGDTAGSATPGPVEILLVVDSSDSMQPVAECAGLNVEVLLDELIAVGLTEVRIGVTTAAIDYSRGPTGGIDAGEAGTLVGPMTSDPEELRAQILCAATCWNEAAIPRDTTYACGDPTPDVVSSDYLDCLCGASTWNLHCGTGNEMQIEAAAIALCRGVADPPDGCFRYEGGSGGGSTVMDESDAGSNPGLGTAGARQAVLILTDEGDGSPRLSTGDSDVTPYLDLFASLDLPIAVSTLGPAFVDGDMPCNSAGAQPWGVVRLQSLAESTGGLYAAIEVAAGGECAYTDPAATFEAFARLTATVP